MFVGFLIRSHHFYLISIVLYTFSCVIHIVQCVFIYELRYLPGQLCMFLHNLPFLKQKYDHIQCVHNYIVLSEF